MVLRVPMETTPRFFQIVENKSPYDPHWLNVPPRRTLYFSRDPDLSDVENGADLKSALLNLEPGDLFVIGEGVYSINSYTALDIQGTASAPIRIVAAEDSAVVITRPNAGQNIINVGVNSQARYVLFQGLEFHGGSHGVRLYSCHEVWINQCKIHDTGDVGLSANARDTSKLYITRNEIWNTNGTGEGMYLGGNNGSVIMSESIIALNYVHDTDQNVSQGDGIEVKQGSWGNLIAGNIVHDTNYPCILVYGTAGQPCNIVENNICYRSNDNTMQIQGECIVRNNLVMAGAARAFASQPHQGAPTEMRVVHNTFINTGTAVQLSAWNSGSQMIFANNACYSRNGSALRAVNSTSGVAYAGNVAHGSVTNGVGGFQSGTGLSDFVDLSWDGAQRDAQPSPSSPLLGSGEAEYAVPMDIKYLPRTALVTTGCRRPYTTID